MAAVATGVEVLPKRERNLPFSSASAFAWVDIDNPPPLAFPTQDAALRDLRLVT